MTDRVHRRSLVGGCVAVISSFFFGGYQARAESASESTNLSLNQMFPLGLGPQQPPECDKPTECRFVQNGMASVTSMYCGDPVYDRSGKVVSPLGACNTMTTPWACQSCGKRWEEKTPH